VGIPGTTKAKALLRLLTDRPVVYHSTFTKIAGSATAGVFLSQLFYWLPRQKDPRGIHKSAAEWFGEIGFSRSELETARKHWNRLNVVSWKLSGNSPIRHFYDVNVDQLAWLLSHPEEWARRPIFDLPESSISSFVVGSDCDNQTNQNAEIPQFPDLTEMTEGDGLSINHSDQSLDPQSDAMSPSNVLTMRLREHAASKKIESVSDKIIARAVARTLAKAKSRSPDTLFKYAIKVLETLPSEEGQDDAVIGSDIDWNAEVDKYGPNSERVKRFRAEESSKG
jgi:hypothetical protein